MLDMNSCSSCCKFAFLQPYNCFQLRFDDNENNTLQIIIQTPLENNIYSTCKSLGWPPIGVQCVLERTSYKYFSPTEKEGLIIVKMASLKPTIKGYLSC